MALYCHLFLFVFVSLFDLSKQKPGDHFSLDDWKKEKNMTDLIPLLNGKNSQEIIECTLWNMTKDSSNGRLRHILRANFSYKICGQKTGTIYVFHLRCLLVELYDQKKLLANVTKDCENFGLEISRVAELLKNLSTDGTTSPPTTSTTSPPTTLTASPPTTLTASPPTTSTASTPTTSTASTPTTSTTSPPTTSTASTPTTSTTSPPTTSTASTPTTSTASTPTTSTTSPPTTSTASTPTTSTASPPTTSTASPPTTSTASTPTTSTLSPPTTSTLSSATQSTAQGKTQLPNLSTQQLITEVNIYPACTGESASIMDKRTGKLHSL
ncbi:uncharacterized protein FYW61_016718 [Anableps anableps]